MWVHTLSVLFLIFGWCFILLFNDFSQVICWVYTALPLFFFLFTVLFSLLPCFALDKCILELGELDEVLMKLCHIIFCVEYQIKLKRSQMMIVLLGDLQSKSCQKVENTEGCSMDLWRKLWLHGAFDWVWDLYHALQHPYDDCVFWSSSGIIWNIINSFVSGLVFCKKLDNYNLFLKFQTQGEKCLHNYEL